MWDGGVSLELESQSQYITASFPLWDPMSRSNCHGIIGSGGSAAVDHRVSKFFSAVLCELWLYLHYGCVKWEKVTFSLGFLVWI